MRAVTQTKHRSGERGIRALACLYLSASYRIQIANVATFAINATDHCTLLHAAGRESFPYVFATPSYTKKSEAKIWRDRKPATMRIYKDAVAGISRRREWPSGKAGKAETHFNGPTENHLEAVLIWL